MKAKRIKAMIFLIAISLLGGTVLADDQTREPEYQVVKKYKDFEVRRYAAYLVAETEVKSSFESVAYEGFQRLAGYIGGKNRKQEEISMTTPVKQQAAEQKGEKIAMTSPVIQQPAEEQSEKIPMTSPVIQQPGSDEQGSEAYVLSFVMPAKYSIANIPEPLDSRVKIREVPARLVAARTYSGTWSEENYRENEEILLKALRQSGLKTVGKPVFARYNPPWSLWFMRRNEVQIEINEQSMD